MRHNIFRLQSSYQYYCCWLGVCLRTKWFWVRVQLVLLFSILGSPNYILVSCLCLSYPCPVIFVLYFMPFQKSTHYVSQSLLLAIYPYLLNICIVLCYNYPLVKYILQLILVFTCSSCASLLPYIPSICLAFGTICLAFLEALSVYLQPVYSFALSLLNQIPAIPQQLLMVIERFIK